MRQISYSFTTVSDGNLAFHVGDNHENVLKNHQALAKKLNFDINNLRHMNQVHGNNVEIITHESEHLIKNCDAMITCESNIPLLVMVADCIPIVLFDKEAEIIAVVHAGRNSTFQRIVQNVVKIMMDKFLCKVENIEAIMGPSIQKCCYEVSDQMAKIVEESFSKDCVDKRHIDLQKINKLQLEEMGIRNIDISSICTKCTNDKYFSYRKDKKCGRFGAIATINDE